MWTNRLWINWNTCSFVIPYIYLYKNCHHTKAFNKATSGIHHVHFCWYLQNNIVKGNWPPRILIDLNMFIWYTLDGCLRNPHPNEEKSVCLADRFRLYIRLIFCVTLSAFNIPWSKHCTCCVSFVTLASKTSFCGLNNHVTVKNYT